MWGGSPTASSLPSQLHRFVSMNKLKYFFAVDTAYVAKKLGLLVFPYTHQVSAWGRGTPRWPAVLAPPPAAATPSGSDPAPGTSAPPSSFSHAPFFLLS